MSELPLTVAKSTPEYLQDVHRGQHESKRGEKQQTNINSVKNVKVENTRQVHIHYTIDNNIFSHPIIITCAYSQPIHNIMKYQLHMKTCMQCTPQLTHYARGTIHECPDSSRSQFPPWIQSTLNRYHHHYNASPIST